MVMISHYLPYILAAGLAGLVLFCMFEGSGTKKSTKPERVKRIHYGWDDNSTHHD